MRKQHGDLIYFIEGEGFVPELDISKKVPSFVTRRDDKSKSEPEFKFSRMLERNSDDPKYEGLVKLGKAMTKEPDAGDDPSLPPAGFTFLGQFIAHDMSFDLTKGFKPTWMTEKDISTGRSPSLDLDNLYDKGPRSNPRLYEKDGVHLKIGSTSSQIIDGDILPSYKNDLPREESELDNPRKATIADPRNDDNLGIAQIHVAFLKFHNSVVDVLAEQGLSGKALFEAARREVVLHYQSIVINDYLPAVIDNDVWKGMLNDNLNDPKFFKHEKKSKPTMPIEFSFAAFRFGHSMLRDTYEWNRIFRSPMPGEMRGDLGAAKLHNLFELTGLNGRMESASVTSLPSGWIIDWTRFFDFSGYSDIEHNPQFNRSRKICSTLAKSLATLHEVKEFLKDISEDYRSLAAMDMLRGANLGLPTGQEVAKLIPDKKHLTEDQIMQGPHADILKSYGFDKNTPLFYYILKEAEIFHDGRHLGPVGTHIVANTFVELIWASSPSIFREKDWHPQFVQREGGKFCMADLLVFVKKRNPAQDELNPLGKKN